MQQSNRQWSATFLHRRPSTLGIGAASLWWQYAEKSQQTPQSKSTQIIEGADGQAGTQRRSDADDRAQLCGPSTTNSGLTLWTRRLEGASVLAICRRLRSLQRAQHTGQTPVSVPDIPTASLVDVGTESWWSSKDLSTEREHETGSPTPVCQNKCPCAHCAISEGYLGHRNHSSWP